MKKRIVLEGKEPTRLSLLGEKAQRFRNTVWGKLLDWIVALLPALIAVGFAVYYITGPGEGYFHSDCSDSLYWANASVESGHVFDETYRYAGLLPFSASLWMIPLIQIFGFGMTAHNAAMIIFAVLFAAAIWFCLSSAGFGKGWCGAAVFAVMMGLSSSDKLREILWGHTIYYSMGLILLFASAGFALRLFRALQKKHYVRAGIYALVSGLLAAGTATDGMQVIVLSVLPVAAAVIAERLFCGEDKLCSRNSLYALGTVAVLGVGTLIGLKLLAAWKGENISAGYADAYSGWSDVGIWADNARAFVKQYFSLIGAVPQDLGNLFAKESLASLIRIAVGIVILLVPVIMLCFYKKLSGTGVRVLLWAHFVVTAAILFGWICGKLSGANWRLVPLFGSSLLLCFCGARELCFAGKRAREGACEAAKNANAEEAGKDTAAGKRVCVRLGALLCAAVLLFGCLSAGEIKKMPADYGQDNYNHRLARFLEDKGLEYGYATFWYCQAITVISESKVRCREVLAERVGVYSDYYQSSRTWYVNQNYGKYFILLSDYEYSIASQSAMWREAQTHVLAEYRAFGPEDEAAGLGVQGFVITVFDRNVLDPAVMG